MGRLRAVTSEVSVITDLWDRSALPSLEDYIRIPNVSPAFDPEWAGNGHLDRAVTHVARWCEAVAPDRADVEVLRLEGRTPVILVEVAPAYAGDTGTVLLYGHVDKQPPMRPWADGLDPYEPVIRDGRLYGRGGADDGYAAYTTMVAIRALTVSGRPHPRLVVLIEASEESGSPDLPAYLEHLDTRLGEPSLVICLDSGAGNYEQLWATTSLRGTIAGTLTVEVLDEGVHSGDAGGIVPDSFRVARALLDRIEDPRTGAVLLETARVDIPGPRLEQASAAAAVLADRVTDRFPFVPGAQPVTDDPAQAILDRTWRPALAVTGAGGLPPLEHAGNVMRPSTSLRLALRTPPTAPVEEVARELGDQLTADPPHGARVRFDLEVAAPGWHAPPLERWLAGAIEEASQSHFERPAEFMGEGGTIPFMAMLGERFPDAQFLVTGVLGPRANAHGPNEFLHLDYARRLTGCVADVLAACVRRR